MPEHKEVMEMYKTAMDGNLIGMKVTKIWSYDRYKADGTPFKAGRNLQKELKIDSAISVTVSGLAVRGNELVMEFQIECKQNGIHWRDFSVLSFSFANGSCFYWTTDEQLLQYPMSYDAVKRTSRTNLVFDLENGKHWVLLDCSQFKNMAKYSIHHSTQIHRFNLWRSGPDPILEQVTWIKHIQTQLSDDKRWGDIQEWSVAKILTNSDLFPGVGMYYTLIRLIENRSIHTV